MNKYLLIILSTSSITTLHTHAMETDIKTTVSYYEDAMSNLLPCLLTRIHVEILDLIASYLLFDGEESEQDFIKRTKTLTIPEVPKECFNHLPTPRVLRLYTNRMHCPNNKIISLLYGLSADRDTLKESTLVLIIDKTSNELVRNAYLDGRDYLGAAISCKGNLLGIIDLEFDYSKDKDEPEYFKCIVMIINLTTMEKEKHIIPDDFEFPDDHPSTIVFNKQGTHIIINGKDHKQSGNKPNGNDSTDKNPIADHIIIPLTVNTLDSPNEDKKTLANYFIQRLVCKDITKQRFY